MTALHTQQLNITSPIHARNISSPTHLPQQWGTGITFIIDTLFHIPDSPDPGHMNQQGWLPPCRPSGLRWQGKLCTFLVPCVSTVVAKLHRQQPNMNPYRPTSDNAVRPLLPHPSTRHNLSVCKPAPDINQKLPACDNAHSAPASPHPTRQACKSNRTAGLSKSRRQPSQHTMRAGVERDYAGTV